jgi:alkylated DNA repair protein (DNA oxidative demethylase)
MTRGRPQRSAIGPLFGPPQGITLLQGFALPLEEALLAGIQLVVQAAPFRHMVTPGGFTMSVALTNCGTFGWVSDRRGYRYQTEDPETEQPWPAMPDAFMDLAQRAAVAAGFPAFVPDACLINRYAPGARLSLHQDKNETDLSAPIVSVSLGVPATFLFGGLERTDPQEKIPLHHGDVAVWGGKTRLAYHGIMPLKEGQHPRLGAYRINMTFRRAR